jgi:hypothetical protein
VRHSKPSSKGCWSKSSVLLVGDMIVETKIKMFGDVGGFARHILRWACSSQSTSLCGCSLHCYLSSPSDSMIPESPGNSFSNHGSEPSSDFPNCSFCRVVVWVLQSRRFDLNVISAATFHEVCSWLVLLLRSINSQLLRCSKLPYKGLQRLSCIGFLLNRTCFGKVGAIRKHWT